MGLFNNGKEEITTMVANVAAEARKDTVAVRMDLNSYKGHVNGEFEKLLETIDVLVQRMDVLEKEKQELLIATKNEESKIEGCMSLLEVCKEYKIDSPSLQFYFTELGLYSMKINKARNTFKPLIEKIESCEISNVFKVVGSNVYFTEDIADYINKNIEEIKNSSVRYDNKKVQYEKASKRLESKQIKNYQREIGVYCGTGDSYDTKKWSIAYSKLAEKFPTYEEQYKQYAKLHSGNKYAPTKLHYVVNVMGEGHYFLKIVCDLFA